MFFYFFFILLEDLHLNVLIYLDIIGAKGILKANDALKSLTNLTLSNSKPM